MLAAPNADAGRTVSPAALRRLRAHAWPDNTAELATVCAKLADHGTRSVITADNVELALASPRPVSTELATVAAEEKRLLLNALVQNRFRKGQTAAALGISRKTLYNRLKRYGLS